MKFGFIDEHRQVWPVRVMCEALGFSASGYYAWRGRPESRRSVVNREPTEDIRLIHAKSSGCYGSPRVHAFPRRHGRWVSVYTIAHEELCTPVLSAAGGRSYGSISLTRSSGRGATCRLRLTRAGGQS